MGQRRTNRTTPTKGRIYRRIPPSTTWGSVQPLIDKVPEKEDPHQTNELKETLVKILERMKEINEKVAEQPLKNMTD